MLVLRGRTVQQLIDNGDRQQLGLWEKQQPYYLFALVKRRTKTPKAFHDKCEKTGILSKVGFGEAAHEKRESVSR